MFKRFADALEHVLQHNYGISDLLHYLDDFLAVGPLDSRIETYVAGVHGNNHVTYGKIVSKTRGNQKIPGRAEFSNLALNCSLFFVLSLYGEVHSM